MKEEQRNAKLARLEQRWAEVPEETKERIIAGLSAQLGRVIEGDQARKDYLAKARALGNTKAIAQAEELQWNNRYDAAQPEEMRDFVKLWRPLPNPVGPPRKWTSVHFTMIDELLASGDFQTPTSAAKEILRREGYRLADPKGRADRLVKAWRESSPARARRK